MKKIAARAFVFGILSTALFAAISYMLLVANSKLSSGSPLAWFFLAFMAGGAPLAMLLERIPGISFMWLPNPGDGPVGQSMAILAFCACLSWPLFFLVRSGMFSCGAQRGAAPNNSFKPSPLRGLVQVFASFTCPRPQSGPA